MRIDVVEPKVGAGQAIDFSSPAEVRLSNELVQTALALRIGAAREMPIDIHVIL